MGVVHDGAHDEDESFNEIWHLIKSRQDSGGWVLAGIQQVP
jgi:predicted lipid-binding transport protein (Tim44 family)